MKIWCTAGLSLGVWSVHLKPIAAPTPPCLVLHPSVFSLLSKKRSNKYWEVISREPPPSCQHIGKDAGLVCPGWSSVCRGQPGPLGWIRAVLTGVEGDSERKWTHTLAVGCPPWSQLGWIFPFFIAKADPSLGNPPVRGLTSDIDERSRVSPQRCQEGSFKLGPDHVTSRWTELLPHCPESPSENVTCSVLSDEAHQLQNTGAGSHSLLQGIFLTQESNLGLLHCTQILYHLSY